MRKAQTHPNPVTNFDSESKVNISNLHPVLMKLVMGNMLGEAIRVAVKMDLAGLLSGRERTDEELAAETGTKVAPLYRLLQLLVNVEILKEPEPHHFALTEMGQLLRKDVAGSVYTTALFFGTPRIKKLWENLLYSLQTGESANQSALGMPTWEYYEQHPEEASIFYSFMTESSNQVIPSFIANYNFEGVKTIADIGGAQGNMLSAILKANPNLEGVLLDLPQITQGARDYLTKQGVADRCQVIGGNMFEPWPLQADLYLISRVLSNWSDTQIIDILKNCRQAMKPGSKFILIERILPEDPGTALIFYLFDLQMLVGPGGQDHSLEEYRDFMAAAGLRLTRNIPLTAPFSLMEAVVA